MARKSIKIPSQPQQIYRKQRKIRHFLWKIHKRSPNLVHRLVLWSFLNEMYLRSIEFSIFYRKILLIKCNHFISMIEWKRAANKIHLQITLAIYLFVQKRNETKRNRTIRFVAGIRKSWLKLQTKRSEKHCNQHSNQCLIMIIIRQRTDKQWAE